MQFNIKKIKNLSLVVIITLILFSILAVGLVKTYTPRINEYRDDFKSWINQGGNYELDFTKVGARWRLIGPEIIFYDPEIKNKKTQEKLFYAGEATAEIGILDFLLGRSLAIDQLTFNSIDLDLSYTNTGGFILQGVNFDVFASFFRNSSNEISSFNLIGEDVRLNVNLNDMNRVIELLIPMASMEINAEEIKIDTTFDLPGVLGESMLLSASKRNDGGQLSSEWRLYIEGQSLNLRDWMVLQSNQLDNFQGGLIDVDAWMELSSKKIESVTADLEISDLFLSNHSDEPLFLESRLEYSTSEFGWFAALDKFKFYTKNANWPESRIQIQAHKNDENITTSLDVSASIIVLENLRFFNNWIETDFVDYIFEMNPQGLLRDSRLNISNANQANSMFNLSAQLDGVSINLTNNKGQIDGLDGYLSVNRDGGRLEVDTSNLGLDFNDYISNKVILDQAKGEIIWRKNSAGLKVSSKQFELRNIDFKSNTNIELSFLTKLNSPYLDIESSWSIENITAIKRLVPENKMNPALYQWMQESIQSGRVTNGKARIIGSVENFPFSDRNGIFQINAQIKDLLLRYAMDWPETNIQDMHLTFDRNQIYSYKNNLLSNKLELSDASIEIKDIFNPKLQIQANSTAKLGALHNFMMASPIDTFFGKKLKNIKLVGVADYQFDIHLPLRSAQRKNYNFTTQIKPKNARLSVTWIAPAIENLNGIINISRNDASSEYLNAQFIGKPVLISLTKATEDREFMSSIISIEGVTSINAIERDFEYKFNDSLAGENIKYQLSLNIPRYDLPQPKPFFLNIKSDLKQAVINLPYPFSGEIKGIRQLDMNLLFPSEDSIHLDGQLYSDIRWDIYFKKNNDSWAFNRGTVFLGDGPIMPLDSRGLHIRGNTDWIQFDDWMKFTRVNVNKNKLADSNFIRSIDLTMENLFIFGRSFEQQRVVANRGSSSWIIDLYGEQAEGLINFPYEFNGQQPIELNMDTLNIGKSNGAWNGSKLSPIDFPPIYMKIKEFAFSDHFFGSLNADFVKFDDGLRAVDIETTAPSFTIKANAGWVLDESYNSGQHTYIDGRLSSSDTMDTLIKLDYQPIIDSSDMNIDIDVKWPGGPREDYINYVQGDFNVSLGAGQLEEVEPGAGRMFGLLSVVALPRRLSLDFRDVFNKGFGFDEIIGDFKLNEGKAITCNLNLKGPAADIGVLGSVDLIAMEYDQAAIVSTNYGNTLPIVGAVVAGPPAAAALLLFSQIFKKPLQEMAQIYYDVLGTFEVPKINNTNAQNFALMSEKYECIS
ncbi:MAG: YhdP family protein [Woeseiaceae bacterium]